MKIVADESVDRQIVERRREKGHEVLSVAELDPGIDDETVLRRSREGNAVLVTADKDFGQLVFQQGLTHSGILLIRLEGLAPEAKAELVGAMFEQHAEELSAGFSVLTERTFRVRRARR